MGLRVWAYLAGLAVAGMAHAFEPASLPASAVATHDVTEAPASMSFPVAVFDDSLPMQEAEGRLHQRAWRVPAPTLPTLRLVRGLRADLAAAGYEIILDCATEVCGGFDFRFGLTVLPAPAMNVDLFDFRVITAQRSAGGKTDYVYILVSKGRANRYVQLFDLVSDAAGAAPQGEASSGAGPDRPEAVSGLVADLRRLGHVALSDLDFASGAGGLSDRSYASLAALAAFLKGDAARVVAVVGHTDAVGSLEVNVALSKRRAEAVRARLISRYGVPGAQVQAQGAGYMAPVASNLTAEGREANRRVEAVLLGAD